MLSDCPAHIRRRGFFITILHRARRLAAIFTLAAAFVVLSGCEMIFFLSSGGEALGENLPEHFELIYRQRDLRNAVLNGGIQGPDEYFQGKNVHGAFQTESDILYITFFGSESPADYFDNMIHLLIDAPFSGAPAGMQVHAGFSRGYDRVKDQIRVRVQAHLDAGHTRVVVEGHSSGAAIATLCAADLWYLYESRGIDLFCFPSASPRVGNRAFAEEFDRHIECRRYINGDDLFPSLPGEGMGFIHVGIPHRIGSPPNPLRAGMGLWILDHFITDYAGSIDAGLF